MLCFVRPYFIELLRSLKTLYIIAQISVVVFQELIMFIFACFLQDPDGNDNKSESGSFHALAWEEERSRRSQVKWAGDYQHPGN